MNEMRVTRLTGRSSTHNIILCTAALLVIFIGCSCRNEDDQSEQTPSQTAKNEDDQHQAPPSDVQPSDPLAEPAKMPPGAESLSRIVDALDHEEPQIREEAVKELTDVNGPEIVHLLIQALGDTSMEVRQTAVEVAAERDDSVKYDVMEEGISSPHNDVKYNVVAELEFSASHKTVEILIAGLKDQDAEFRETVNEALDFLIDREFAGYEEAAAWWKQNKKNYDSELFPNEDE
jgi:type IV secretory pathway VirB10-like protein